MLQTFLHRGLSLLCGRIAEYPRTVCAKLGFVCVNGGFCFMVDRAQRVNVTLTSKVWRCGNRHIILIAQFLHIHL